MLAWHNLLMKQEREHQTETIYSSLEIQLVDSFIDPDVLKLDKDLHIAINLQIIVKDKQDSHKIIKE